MPNSKPSDRSKERICAALLGLMAHESFASISVAAIARQAGVARLTFYRNFDTREEVLLFRLDRLFEECVSAIEGSTATTLEDALTEVFSYWRDQGEFTRLLVKNDLGHLLWQPMEGYLSEMLGRFNLVGVFTSVQQRFIVGGLYALMLDQAQEGNKTDARKAARQVLALLQRADIPALRSMGPSIG